MKNIFLTAKINILFIIIILYFNLNKKYILFSDDIYNSTFSGEFYLFNSTNILGEKVQYLNIFDLKYLFSFKYNIIKIEYKFGLYEYDKKIISPSQFFSKNINFICSIKIFNNNISINSLPNIYEDKYYKCVEYYEINEKINFGIKIYERKENNDNYTNTQDDFIFLFKEDIVNYNEYEYKNNSLFEPHILIEKYTNKIKKMNDYRYNKTLKLEKSYIRFPYFLLRRFSVLNENTWNYGNIYDCYFCFCKGFNCLKIKISQKCKYYFNLNIINNNRNVYNKTDYLFVDFIFSELSSDDAFPIFKEMFNQNLPVHYMTESIDIFNEFGANKNKCGSIIYVNKNNYTINGDFIEKYLTLFLKLKEVISGGGINFNYINNLFYNIEYISLISITHGVCFFKYFLYEDYNCYGLKRIDKLLIPPSKKIISMAKKYGWKDENLIKLNLPKWDKYNINNSFFTNCENKEFKNNSIFFLFTWREIKKNQEISPFYFQNINNLLRNGNLKESLEKKNIILYFTLHHKIYNYKRHMNIFKKYKYLKFIDEKEISKCLAETSLVISDFSSIIFDIIYKGKPFVIYIPDGNDPNIKKIYSKRYYELFI
jgi:CDP-glycerol glycerophosphotransferase (TagB/SpsB family)